MNKYTITVHRGVVNGRRDISAYVNGVDQNYYAKPNGKDFDVYRAGELVAAGLKPSQIHMAVFNHLGTLYANLKADY